MKKISRSLLISLLCCFYTLLNSNQTTPQEINYSESILEKKHADENKRFVLNDSHKTLIFESGNWLFHRKPFLAQEKENDVTDVSSTLSQSLTNLS